MRRVTGGSAPEPGRRQGRGGLTLNGREVFQPRMHMHEDHRDGGDPLVGQPRAAADENLTVKYSAIAWPRTSSARAARSGMPAYAEGTRLIPCPCTWPRSVPGALMPGSVSIPARYFVSVRAGCLFRCADGRAASSGAAPSLTSVSGNPTRRYTFRRRAISRRDGLVQASARRRSVVHGGEQNGVGADQRGAHQRKQRAVGQAAFADPPVGQAHRADPVHRRRPDLGLWLTKEITVKAGHRLHQVIGGRLPAPWSTEPAGAPATSRPRVRRP